MPDEINDGLIISTEYRLTVKTSIFDGLSVEETMTVEGDSYVVREVRKTDDGKFMKVSLSKS